MNSASGMVDIGNKEITVRLAKDSSMTKKPVHRISFRPIIMCEQYPTLSFDSVPNKSNISPKIPPGVFLA